MSGTNGTDITNASATETPSNYEVCQRTGFRLEAGKLVREWTGEYVRPQSFEERHPLDLLRAQDKEKASPISNPEPDDQFVEDLYPAGVTGTSL